ncbi:putative GST-like protein YibF [Microbulbifer aggregans]|uniref:Putative GST-like protein YibF n=1 Tax=Microbulbifer aggregans TaxID=1769779 RepID=A0A1C9W3J9_9GAMM|nr:glutathione S-transferase N-terminal domain-containing protein [Microbulbifer aggregans]AOS95721.1 putative GST-like protein YibF [Microbulbifer aggregans]
MKLFLTHSSPYARSARIILRESNLLEQVQETESHPFSNDPDFLTANPLGKVPCLVTDDGHGIMDSEVICAYLDRELGDGRLGKALEKDWQLRTYYSVCSGLIDTLVLLRIEKGREHDGLRSEFWWQRYQDAIRRTLDYLEQQAALLPGELSLAHINLAATLGYLDFRHAEIDWRNNHKRLAEITASLEQRQAFRDTTLRD